MSQCSILPSNVESQSSTSFTHLLHIPSSDCYSTSQKPPKLPTYPLLSLVLYPFLQFNDKLLCHKNVKSWIDISLVVELPLGCSHSALEYLGSNPSFLTNPSFLFMCYLRGSILGSPPQAWNTWTEFQTLSFSLA